MPNTRKKLIEILEKSPYLDVLGGYLDYETATDHLIANGVTVQEWISLAERKPNRDDLVIVFFEGMKYTPAAIQIMYGWCIGGSASHWMSLPQPPKGE
jgi:hypothetical protein